MKRAQGRTERRVHATSGSFAASVTNVSRGALAAELLLPALIQRDPKDITRIDPSRGPPRGQTLDYLFDEQHLTASLRTYCPQMKLHRTVHDLYDVPSVLEPIRLTHRELGMSYVNESVLAAPSKWGSQLLAMVEKKSPAASRAFPVRVNIERSIFTWPNTYDAQPLARAMGRLLRPREDARRVAAAALFQLHKQFRLGLDPRMGIKRESFVGVHLRTERDVQTTFPDYLHQAVHFMDYAVDAKVPVVFLGTGATQENVTAFTDRMEDFNVTVVTKHSLLKDHHPDEYKLLEGLTFDQKGLVDYEVMLRGGLFAGRCESPFAWNVALRRVSAFSGSVGGDNKIKPHDSVRYQDRYSVLYGLSACSLFMQSSMWP